MSNSKCIVTLIHGTFAQHAPWTAEGSLLRERIAGAIGHPVEFEVFNWSGLNHHAARSVATEELRSFLKQQMLLAPEAERFLVAHSHGGNIAVNALADVALQSRISGIVTMGTPFISCRSRDIDGAMDTLKIGIPCILAIFLVIPFPVMILQVFKPGVFHFANPVVSGGEWPLVLGVFAIGYIGGFYLCRWLFHLLDDEVRWWAHRRQERVAAKFQTPSFDKPPLLCATVAGDEARLWLTGIRNTSNSSNLLFAIIVRVLSWSIVTIPMLFLLGFVGFLWHSMFNLIGVAAIVLIALVIAAILLQIPMVLLPVIVRGHRFGFGGEGLFDNWLADIAVSSQPPEVPCDLMKVTPETTATKVINHSYFFESTEFLDEMGKWLGERVVR